MIFMTFVLNSFRACNIMGVNVFGAAGSSKISTDNDQKFKTLSTNLALKLNKSGDSMTGDLKLLLSDERLRTFGVSDITSGKSVSLLLGDELNQIRHDLGRAIEIDAQHGLKVTCQHGEVLQIGTQIDASAIFFNDVIMRDNSIKNLRDSSLIRTQSLNCMLTQSVLKTMLVTSQI